MLNKFEVIRASVTIPDMEIVGAEMRCSEKWAVIVTTSVFFTILLESVSVKITVGGMLSLISSNDIETW